jgi:hypothetical protein
MTVPTSLRTYDTEVRYQLDKAEGKTRPLEEEPSIQDWERWRLIDNSYPYDAVFEKHHMLIPTEGYRQTVKDDDLHAILEELAPEYDFWFVNFPHRQSIKNLLHIHLVKHKSREEMQL